MKKKAKTKKRVLKYEYEVQVIDARSFSKLVYFCTNSGECSADKVPGDQIKILKEILNSQGRLGWELVQSVFSNSGVLCVWKRKRQ